MQTTKKISLPQPQYNLWGYCRVSSKSQQENFSLENQKETLINFGVPENQIIVEIGSAAQGQRPGLTTLEAKLTKDNVLVVTSLDRYGRNLASALNRIEKLEQKGVSILPLNLVGMIGETGTTNNASAMSKMIVIIALAFSEMEWELRRERQREGIKKAKLIPGKYPGRKSKLDNKKLHKLRNWYYGKNKKEIEATDMAKILGVSKSTLYRWIQHLEKNAR